jgi:hypothetical protein
MGKPTLVAFAILLGLVAIGGIAPFVIGRYVEHRRSCDADPAFLPLLPLGVSVLSNPCGFNRYCNYVVEFSPKSTLSDANAHKLRCLVQLPDEYRLDMFIRTMAVTDSSLPYLKAIRNLDGLDVTETSISDQGIDELRLALPRAEIARRGNPQVQGTNMRPSAEPEQPATRSDRPARL